ncbi:DNA binding protein [Bacillus phage vB_BpuM-BpSp]|nr:DNA binding protein [Bacillus phage vB_BpuM-BpSp]
MSIVEMQKALKAKVEEKEGLKLTEKEARAVYESVVELIKEDLNKDKETSTTLPGLGSLNVKVRKAYTGRNPQTGEAVEIPEARTVSFKAHKAIKDHLNQ